MISSFAVSYCCRFCLFHSLFNEEGNNNEIILSAEAVITEFYNEAGAYFDSSTALIMVICSNASDTREKSANLGDL